MCCFCLVATLTLFWQVGRKEDKKKTSKSSKEIMPSTKQYYLGSLSSLRCPQLLLLLPLVL